MSGTPEREYSKMPHVSQPTVARTATLTVLAMLAFAANSLLCRAALRDSAIDPAGFTLLRLLSGALVLGLLVRWRQGGKPLGGSWLSAAALFVYAAGFSYAYVSLSAATGALLLFGAVQATMLGYGFWRGERLRAWQTVGLVCACGGLAGLLMPGLSAPPWGGALLMLLAGAAWGIYSLRGKGAGDATVATAGNFVRSVPMALVLGAATWSGLHMNASGAVYALLSGAIASGMGYAIWYSALPGLRAASAASVQLSVPAVAALGAVLFLGEALELRLVLASVAILGGIALVIARR
jgi:drug/metabolite transporter (DMT)-like permease